MWWGAAEMAEEMHLSVFNEGLSRPVEMLFPLLGRVMHQSRDDLRVLLYRPGFLGFALLKWCFTALRTPRDRGGVTWSFGEIELFGAFTSRMNQCPF